MQILSGEDHRKVAVRQRKVFLGEDASMGRESA